MDNLNFAHEQQELIDYEYAESQRIERFLENHISTEQDFEDVNADVNNNDTDANDNDKENEEPGNREMKCCETKCLSLLPMSDIESNQMNMSELEKSEKENVIMSAIYSNCDFRSDTKRGKRKKSVTKYHFLGIRVCRKAFMKIYDITDYTLRALTEHVIENGVTPRKHGNTGKRPHNALSYENVQHVVNFLRNTADEFGYPQPAAPRGTDDIPPIYLPSSMTKISIYNSFK